MPAPMNPPYNENSPASPRASVAIAKLGCEPEMPSRYWPAVTLYRHEPSRSNIGTAEYGCVNVVTCPSASVIVTSRLPDDDVG